MSLQEKIISDLHVKPSINPKEEIDKRVRFLKDYLIHTRAKGFVLGISGGQDSALSGRLAQIAVEELRQEGYEVTFYALRLPYKSQLDEDDAQLSISFIKPDIAKTFNISTTVDAFAEHFATSNQPLSDFNKGNVKARVRMITQYAFAGEHNLLVIGTDHAAEALTGFFTKYGDGGADLLPLTGLNKRQGRALLQELQAPEQLYKKKPTADLLDNVPQQEDETELGMTYDEIDDYLEGKDIGIKSARIEKRYVATEHKRQVPATMYDTWWK
ncbi:ammonia-dependent NAD(+) synthetase [Bacillus carboniphilus]|uniref:NH(3)-dependent NAD(+) synthetase n=1 Tax=Bacillus carboniphilus TaxID=86663 RepID=A0ABY9JUG8_9BACI|nr:ammonia-dependent NAD(+) synthetase [Bacillus carboniphilus]WLR43056.1 ammonia-dependent NAD(+) synthetase [Bacillus carboniphilus]